jgi:hypothetical protein
MPVFHPVFRPVALLALVLVLAGCSSRPDAALEPDANPCSVKKKNDPQKPYVCIDDSGAVLTATPYHVLVHDSEKNDKTKPVKIDWYTTSGGGDLRLKIYDTCVEAHSCNGNGHCWTKTKPGSVDYGEIQQCKYDVWIQNGAQPVLDPTIIITGCC